MCSNFLIPKKIVGQQRLSADLNGHSTYCSRPFKCPHKDIITPIMKRMTDKESNLLILNFPQFLVGSLISSAFCY
jgi:hypothetical protein